MSHLPSRGHGHNSPNFGYIDPIAVERAVNGDPPANLYTAEIRQAVAILICRGYGTRDIARRIGVAERTVLRHKNQLRDETEDVA